MYLLRAKYVWQKEMKRLIFDTYSFMLLVYINIAYNIVEVSVFCAPFIGFSDLPFRLLHQIQWVKENAWMRHLTEISQRCIQDPVKHLRWSVLLNSSSENCRKTSWRPLMLLIFNVVADLQVSVSVIKDSIMGVF